MQGLKVIGLNGNRIEIDLTDKAQQGFLRFRKRGAIEISEDGIHEFLAAEQFRRDRGVRLGSKRALIEMRRICGNQFAQSGRERCGLS